MRAIIRCWRDLRSLHNATLHALQCSGLECQSCQVNLAQIIKCLTLWCPLVFAELRPSRRMKSRKPTNPLQDRRCDVGLASCGAPCLFPTELGEIFSPTRCDVASFWWWWWWGGVRVIGWCCIVVRSLEGVGWWINGNKTDSGPAAFDTACRKHTAIACAQKCVKVISCLNGHLPFLGQTFQRGKNRGITSAAWRLAQSGPNVMVDNSDAAANMAAWHKTA